MNIRLELLVGHSSRWLQLIFDSSSLGWYTWIAHDQQFSISGDFLCWLQRVEILYFFCADQDTNSLAGAHRSGSISNAMKSRTRIYLDDLKVVGIGLNSNRPALTFFCFKERIDCGNELDIYAICLEEALMVCGCL